MRQLQKSAKIWDTGGWQKVPKIWDTGEWQKVPQYETLANGKKCQNMRQTVALFPSIAGWWNPAKNPLNSLSIDVWKKAKLKFWKIKISNHKVCQGGFYFSKFHFVLFRTWMEREFEGFSAGLCGPTIEAVRCKTWDCLTHGHCFCQCLTFNLYPRIRRWRRSGSAGITDPPPPPDRARAAISSISSSLPEL